MSSQRATNFSPPLTERRRSPPPSFLSGRRGGGPLPEEESGSRRGVQTAAPEPAAAPPPPSRRSRTRQRSARSSGTPSASLENPEENLPPSSNPRRGRASDSGGNGRVGGRRQPPLPPQPNAGGAGSQQQQTQTGAVPAQRRATGGSEAAASRESKRRAPSPPEFLPMDEAAEASSSESPPDEFRFGKAAGAGSRVGGRAAGVSRPSVEEEAAGPVPFGRSPGEVYLQALRERGSCRGAFGGSPSDSRRSVFGVEGSARRVDCGVCCEKSACVAVGPCPHVTCWGCALKLRLGGRQLRCCPFCFAPAPLVLLLCVVEKAELGHLPLPEELLEQPFFTTEAASAMPPHLVDMDSGLCFASMSARRFCEALLQLRCWLPQCSARWLASYVFCSSREKQIQQMLAATAAAAAAKEAIAKGSQPERSAARGTLQFTGPATADGVYSTLPQLDRHLAQEHSMRLCGVCLEGRSEQLLVEQLLLPPHLLRLHLQQQGGAFKQIPQALHLRQQRELKALVKQGVTVYIHPKCSACGMRCLDGEALLQHIRREHFWCTICEEDCLKKPSEVHHSQQQSAAAGGSGAANGATASRSRRGVEGPASSRKHPFRPQREDERERDPAEEVPVFLSQAELQRHSTAAHYPCPHSDSCPLTVFRDNCELALHLSRQHGGCARPSPAAAAAVAAAEAAASEFRERNQQTLPRLRRPGVIGGGFATRTEEEPRVVMALRGNYGAYARMLNTFAPQQDPSTLQFMRCEWRAKTSSAKQRDASQSGAAGNSSPQPQKPPSPSSVCEREDAGAEEETPEAGPVLAESAVSSSLRVEATCTASDSVLSAESSLRELGEALREEGQGALLAGAAKEVRTAGRFAQTAALLLSDAEARRQMRSGMSGMQRLLNADEIKSIKSQASALTAADLQLHQRRTAPAVSHDNNNNCTLNKPSSNKTSFNNRGDDAGSASTAEWESERKQLFENFASQLVLALLPALLHREEETKSTGLETLLDCGVPPPQSAVGVVLTQVALGAGDAEKRSLLAGALQTAACALEESKDAPPPSTPPQESSPPPQGEAEGAEETFSFAAALSCRGVVSSKKGASDKGGPQSQREKAKERESKARDKAAAEEKVQRENDAAAAAAFAASLLETVDLSACPFASASSFLEALSWVVTLADDNSEDAAAASPSQVGGGSSPSEGAGPRVHKGKLLQQHHARARQQRRETGSCWGVQTALSSQRLQAPLSPGEREASDCWSREALGEILSQRTLLELQQLSLMARDLTPLIPNAKLLEELQALGPSFYRLRRVAGEGAQREVQQKAWVQRCVAVVRQAASEELRALRLYVHMAQERLPESEKLLAFPALQPASSSASSSAVPQQTQRSRAAEAAAGQQFWQTRTHSRRLGRGAEEFPSLSAAVGGGGSDAVSANARSKSVATANEQVQQWVRKGPPSFADAAPAASSTSASTQQPSSFQKAQQPHHRRPSPEAPQQRRRLTAEELADAESFPALRAAAPNPPAKTAALQSSPQSLSSRGRREPSPKAFTSTPSQLASKASSRQQPLPAPSSKRLLRSVSSQPSSAVVLRGDADEKPREGGVFGKCAAGRQCALCTHENAASNARCRLCDAVLAPPSAGKGSSFPQLDFAAATGSSTPWSRNLSAAASEGKNSSLQQSPSASGSLRHSPAAAAAERLGESAVFAAARSATPPRAKVISTEENFPPLGGSALSPCSSNSGQKTSVPTEGARQSPGWGSSRRSASPPKSAPKAGPRGGLPSKACDVCTFVNPGSRKRCALCSASLK